MVFDMKDKSTDEEELKKMGSETFICPKSGIWYINEKDHSSMCYECKEPDHVQDQYMRGC
jgi:hypothetical protein